MRALPLSFSLIVSFLSLSIFAADPYNNKLLPIVYSWKKAPWSEEDAPNSFDVSLQSLAYCYGPTILARRDNKRIDSIGQCEDRVCAISGDGNLLGTTDRHGDGIIISISEIDTKANDSLVQNKEIRLLAIASEGNLAAVVTKLGPNIVYIINYEDGSIISIDNGNNIEAIALSSDGKKIAICDASTDLSGSVLENYISIHDVFTKQCLSFFEVRQRVLNMAWNDQLVLEIEGSSGRELKSILLLPYRRLSTLHKCFLQKVIHEAVEKNGCFYFRHLAIFLKPSLHHLLREVDARLNGTLLPKLKEDLIISYLE